MITSERYSVWVGGGEVNDAELTLVQAQRMAINWGSNGYDDVHVTLFGDSAREVDWETGKAIK